MDENKDTSGIFTISNSVFKNNTSEVGTVFNIININKITGSNIYVLNSNFIDNKASKYGGVVHSLGKYNNYHFVLLYCNFINNYAYLGNDIYSISRESMPYITNIKQLESTKNSVATNPTSFKLNDNSIDRISIFSGDTIPNNILCI